MEFKDRSALNPGRVRLTPVSGSSDLYDMVWEDNVIDAGTALNKATFDQFRSELSDLIIQNAGAQGEKGEKGETGVTLDKKSFLVGTNSSSGAGWYKLGSVTLGSYCDYHAKILITRTFYGMSMPSGMIDVDVRYGSSSWENIGVKWETFCGDNPSYIRYYASSAGILTFYGYIPQQYAYYRVDIIGESNRDGYNNLFEPMGGYGGVWQTRYMTSTPTSTGYPTSGTINFFSWVYTSQCASDKIVSCTKSTHGLSTVKGAIVIPRSTATSKSALSGYDNITLGTCRYGVTISGTTVYIAFDDGTFVNGFYCLIYGV